MNDLGRTQWRPRAEPTSSFLKRLGIEVVTAGRGGGFWFKNEHQLEYLFYDMCQRAKPIKVALHPQNGGDSLEFAAFVTAFDQAKRAFFRHGVGDSSSAAMLIQEREDQYIRKLASARLTAHRAREKKRLTPFS